MKLGTERIDSIREIVRQRMIAESIIAEALNAFVQNTGVPPVAVRWSVRTTINGVPIDGVNVSLDIASLA